MSRYIEGFFERKKYSIIKSYYFAVFFIYETTPYVSVCIN